MEYQDAENARVQFKDEVLFLKFVLDFIVFLTCLFDIVQESVRDIAEISFLSSLIHNFPFS